MPQFLCTIHQVVFTAEPKGECSADIKQAISAMRCPMCFLNDYRRLVDEVDSLRKQRDCLILAIELKQRSLVVPL